MQEKLQRIGQIADIVKTNAGFIIDDCNHLGLDRFKDDWEAVDSMKQSMLTLDLAVGLLRQRFAELLFRND